jgi:flagellar basal body P-ring protein FlgI
MAMASASGLASSPVQILALMKILSALGISVEQEKIRTKNKYRVFVKLFITKYI